MSKIILFILFSAFLFPLPTLAGLGVGVGTGKMVVDDILKPGTIYELPTLSVINTGDVPATYGVGISHRETQIELRPDGQWFRFDPPEFFLKPGENQIVKVTMLLPLKVQPGKYFAFVEGHPVQSKEGGTSIGLAAAAKLYFEVAPANIFVGLYYRLLTLWRHYLPWSNIVGVSIGVFVIFRFLRSRFSFRISRKTASKKPKEQTDSDE